MFKEDILPPDVTTVIPPEGNLYHTLSYAGLLKPCTNRERLCRWLDDRSIALHGSKKSRPGIQEFFKVFTASCHNQIQQSYTWPRPLRNECVGHSTSRRYNQVRPLLLAKGLQSGQCNSITENGELEGQDTMCRTRPQSSYSPENLNCHQAHLTRPWLELECPHDFPLSSLHHVL